MPWTSPLAEALAPGLLERFERYVRVHTTAARARTGSPSTPGQLELGRMLAGELVALGLTDVVQDADGYVYGTLEATVDDAPTIGLLAHLDTSPDAPGEGVEPLVHPSYDGSVITLPRGGTVLDPAVMGELGSKVGHTIVTGSGDTLLGADDKAGVAEIVTAAGWLAAHPELPRPRVRVCFTPDEEVGLGAELFDVAGFGADCAYTLDGSDLGELQDETFTAVGVRLVVEGVDIHPGSAYGVMVNAAVVAAAIVAALPRDRLTPDTTRGREGFVHVVSVAGDAVRCEVRAIVRDFEDVLRDAHVALLRTVAGDVVASFPGARLAAFEVEEQYPNMRAFLAPYPEIVAAAEAAYRAEGVEPVRSPIRGGTDGSRLSSMGLPTPNLWAGGHAFHSVREWTSLQDMASAAAMLVRLCEAWTAPERRGFRLGSRG